MTTRTLPPAAYDKVTATVGRDTGEQRTATLWTHAAALVRHAHDHGLAPTDDRPAGPDGLLKSLESLADCHPSLAPLADPAVLPLWEQPLGATAWAAIEEFWDRHPALEDEHRVDGYALGDTYQLLSEEARKGRALCQTPPWVARLLLRLSLEPAMEEWGPANVRMIDPACGTGHIAVAAFHMTRVPPVRGRRPAPVGHGPQAVERALAAVTGVDLDAYAVALTAYRLLASSASVLGVSLDRVPASWPVNVTAADSLLDRTEPLLAAGTYHACVANPPYITPKDPVVRDQVRAAYPQVAAGKYSLALPFTALMLEHLAVPDGFVAQLTANSFMKREFGRRYVTEFLPRFDARWIIDTSGAYIPGHGTPTCILVHRARPPVGDTVTVVRGNRGEPHIPEDPAQGLVWRAIEEAVDSRLAWDRFQAGADLARRDRRHRLDVAYPHFNVYCHSQVGPTPASPNHLTSAAPGVAPSQRIRGLIQMKRNKPLIKRRKAGTQYMRRRPYRWQVRSTGHWVLAVPQAFVGTSQTVLDMTGAVPAGADESSPDDPRYDGSILRWRLDRDGQTQFVYGFWTWGRSQSAKGKRFSARFRLSPRYIGRVPRVRSGTSRVRTRDAVPARAALVHGYRGRPGDAPTRSVPDGVLNDGPPWRLIGRTVPDGRHIY